MSLCRGINNEKVYRNGLSLVIAGVVVIIELSRLCRTALRGSQGWKWAAFATMRTIYSCRWDLLQNNRFGRLDELIGYWKRPWSEFPQEYAERLHLKWQGLGGWLGPADLPWMHNTATRTGFGPYDTVLNTGSSHGSDSTNTSLDEEPTPKSHSR